MPWGWLCLLLVALSARAAEGAHPLDSARWSDMRKQFFAGQTVVFDERVKVSAPQFAEDSMNVPVRVDAAELSDVREIALSPT